MASRQQLEQMKRVLDALKGVNRERLLRPGLGEVSLQQAGFGDTFDSILKKATSACEFGANVDDTTFGNAMGNFQNLANVLSQQAGLNNDPYLQQKTNFINQVSSYLQSIRSYSPHFVAAAIEARGFLDDESVRKEDRTVVEEMRTEAQATLKQVRDEYSKIIGEASKIAGDIEQKARRTATHISVKEAQDQFKAAQSDIDKQVRLWGSFATASLLAFFVVAIYLSRVKLSDQWQWHVVYYTAIRVTVLTAVGATATFCLRVLRAQMHMSHHNRHRQRVANSMEAFVEAAVTPEQRDLILAQLVGAIVDFGTSGLLPKEDDTIYGPKFTVDSITRTITNPPTKA